MFGNNKPVYVRPSKKILVPPEESSRKIPRHDLPENIFEYSDSGDECVRNVNFVEAVDQSASKLQWITI